MYYRLITWNQFEDYIDCSTSIFDSTSSEVVEAQDLSKIFPQFLNQQIAIIDDSRQDLYIFKLYTWDHDSHNVAIKVDWSNI